MSRSAASYFASTGRLVVNVLFLVGIAHAHVGMKPEHDGNHTMAVHGSDYPPTYFGISNGRGLIYGHISLMVIGWVFVLPIGEYIIDKPLSLPGVAWDKRPGHEFRSAEPSQMHRANSCAIT
ncbi:hypothetical protein J3459_008117 [Metarhizium acridum]|nr:hypothetical protein J3459_008117 [Metarhizium acridum]